MLNVITIEICGRMLRRSSSVAGFLPRRAAFFRKVNLPKPLVLGSQGGLPWVFEKSYPPWINVKDKKLS
jgi:hypothetical protein